VGFNKRELEDQRRQAVEKEPAARRATDVQVLEDAQRLIAAWNERQAKRMPMLFSPTIGAALLLGIGSCGSVARPAAPRTRSTCARSIDTATRP
jgi:hypothetical protein